MKKLTRKEIDERLKILRETRMDTDSYPMPYHEMAMCYSRSRPEDHTALRFCAECKKSFEINWSSSDGINIENYDTTSSGRYYEHLCLLDKFKAAGLEALMVCNCPECVKAKGLNYFELALKAEDDKNWRVSVPEVVFRGKAVKPKKYSFDSDFGDIVNQKSVTTSLDEYNLILDFLTISTEKEDIIKLFDRLYNTEFRENEKELFEDKERLDFTSCKKLTVMGALGLVREHIGCNEETYVSLAKKEPNRYEGDFHLVGDAECAFRRFVSLLTEKYRELSYRGLNQNEDERYYENPQQIKIIVDCAIYKVLGLSVIYDLTEATEIARHFSLDDKSEFEERLKKSGKKEFTVWELVNLISQNTLPTPEEWCNNKSNYDNAQEVAGHMAATIKSLEFLKKYVKARITSENLERIIAPAVEKRFSQNPPVTFDPERLMLFVEEFIENTFFSVKEISAIMEHELDEYVSSLEYAEDEFYTQKLKKLPRPHYQTYDGGKTIDAKGGHPRIVSTNPLYFYPAAHIERAYGLKHITAEAGTPGFVELYTKEFINKNLSHNFLELCREYGLQIWDWRIALEKTEFKEPLKAFRGKETVCLAEIEEVQKEVNKRILMVYSSWQHLRIVNSKADARRALEAESKRGAKAWDEDDDKDS